MPIADQLIVETTHKVFASACSPELINAAEAGEAPDSLWLAVEEAGLDRAWVPEEFGGVGATLADGFAVARIAGQHAAPVPIAETLAGGWLLASAGIEPPSGAIGIVPAQGSSQLEIDADGQLRGEAARVSFAAQVPHFAACADRDGQPVIALVHQADVELSPSSNLAGENLDRVGFDGVRARKHSKAPAALGTSPALLLGAALRSQQIAGALSAVLEISLQYSQDRIAFGRPISKFQAVQHNLAELASETAAAGVAADGAASAVERFGLGDPRTQFAVAAAKVRAGEAAGKGAAIGHQVHGAMGYTREYPLHHFTRRLWAWRDDFDPETVWATRLGEQVCAAGADALWPTITQI